MKAFAILLLTAFALNAYATEKIIKCSNSDASVTWEQGDQENIINLKYSNFIEGTLTLDLSQVKMQFERELIIKEQTIRTCRFLSLKRVYASKVKITASDKHPDVLRSQFPENKVQTEVICTVLINDPLTCEK